MLRATCSADVRGRIQYQQQGNLCSPCYKPIWQQGKLCKQSQQSSQWFLVQKNDHSHERREVESHSRQSFVRRSSVATGLQTGNKEEVQRKRTSILRYGIGGRMMKFMEHLNWHIIGETGGAKVLDFIAHFDDSRDAPSWQRARHNNMIHLRSLDSDRQAGPLCEGIYRKQPEFL